MTQNACPASAKVSEGSGPFSIPLPHFLCLGRNKWAVMGGSLNLLKHLREVLVEFGGNRMGSREGTYSASPKLWHYSSHGTSTESQLFPQWFVGIVIQGLCAGPPTLLSIFSVCVFSCFPCATIPKSGDPVGAGCEAHLVDISTSAETLPNYRTRALLRGFGDE